MSTNPVALTDLLAEIDIAAAHERWSAARRSADALRLTSAEPALLLAAASLDLGPDVSPSGARSVDAVLLELGALGALPLAAAERRYLHELVATAYVRKRLAGLAASAIAAGEAAAGPSAGLCAAKAAVALLGDDRPAAQAAYLEALALEPGHGAALVGLGRLQYVLGAFADADATLANVPTGSRHWGAAQRTRAAIAAAGGDRHREIGHWLSLRDGRPDSDLAQADGISLALALVAVGERDEALEVLRETWEHDPGTPWGRYARERMTMLAAASPTATRRELTAFPTTAQKWNYCGPAVLELVLRYFDFAADQDAIAAVVKREHGTPMYEIVGHLDRLGIEARRIEATGDRIKAAIDLGCPVIVQEEYSTSSHVAVITGYDDALGVFVVQDPMRHAPMNKPFTFTEAAGAMFGNGAVLVLGPLQTADLVRAGCDAAGLVEADHLRWVDECSRRRPRAVGGDVDALEELSPTEIVSLCDRALARAPGFRLARQRRHTALRSLSARLDDPGTAARDLADIRVRFGGEEWAHWLHALHLIGRGHHDEAFVEALRAHRADPHDEHNLQLMGECRWMAGDLAGGEQYLLAALHTAPDLVRASENLAALYLRALEEIGFDASRVGTGDDDDTDDRDTDEDWDEDGEDGWDDTEQSGSMDGPDRVPEMPPAVVRTRPDLPPSELARRAAHFSSVALAGDPTNAFNHGVAAELARRMGDTDAAIAAYERALAIDPDRLSARNALADLCEHAGDTARAEVLRRDAVERAPELVETHLALADLLRRLDRPADAEVALRAGLARAHGRHEQLVWPLFDALSCRHTSEAASAQLRQLAEQRPADADFLAAALDALEYGGQRGHAIALARLQLELRPGDPSTMWALAQLLDDAGVARDEARELLTRIVELAPHAMFVRPHLAWHLVDRDPEAALEVLAPAAGAELPAVYEAESAALAALGRHTEAAEVLQRALRSARSPHVGLTELVESHVRADRYGRAFHLAAGLSPEKMAATPGVRPHELEHAEWAWFAAHRLAGRAGILLPWARERCAERVPAHLGWELFYAYEGVDPELAARAAEAEALKHTGDDRLTWQIYAATKRAVLGDEQPLADLAASIPRRAKPLAGLAWGLRELERYAEAHPFAEQAYALDPLDNSAFSAWLEQLLWSGDLEGAIACGQRFIADRPWEHNGHERLALIYAKLGRVAEALELSAFAMDAAPYCEISKTSRALATFVAGDYEEALRLANDSIADKTFAEEVCESAMVVAALTGDRARLERGLAKAAQYEPGMFGDWLDRLRAVAADPPLASARS
jgi:tetratricopeptide (TPR) repeat protein